MYAICDGCIVKEFKDLCQKYCNCGFFVADGCLETSLTKLNRKWQTYLNENTKCFGNPFISSLRSLPDAIIICKESKLKQSTFKFSLIFLHEFILVSKMQTLKFAAFSFFIFYHSMWMYISQTEVESTPSRWT